MTPTSLRSHAFRIQTGDEDLPADRFNHHVNNARFFHFINLTFQSWYLAMNIRGGVPEHSAMMAHLSYDFLSELKPPSLAECRIEVCRIGNTSLEHQIEMFDLGHDGDQPPRLVGRGRAVHVWVHAKTRSKKPWPAEVLARFWDADDLPLDIWFPVGKF
ncbi:MAG: thioesterase family protein [Hyphomicrobiales bacterium]|nr:thioesterase family protein [Hyphomicrobiales bacterium]